MHRPKRKESKRAPDLATKIMINDPSKKVNPQEIKTTSTPEAQETKETARPTDGISLPPLSEAEKNAIDQFSENLDRAFVEIKKKYNLSNYEMDHLLHPYISGPNVVSKICALTGKDKRHCNIQIMAAMCCVFGMEFVNYLRPTLPMRSNFRKTKDK